MPLLQFDPATALSLLRASMSLRTWAPADDGNERARLALLFSYACVRMRPALIATIGVGTTESAAAAVAAAIFTEAQGVGTVWPMAHTWAMAAAFKTALSARMAALIDTDARRDLAEAVVLFRHALSLHSSGDALRGAICFKLGQLCGITAVQHLDGRRCWEQTPKASESLHYRLETVGYAMEKAEDWLMTATARAKEARKHLVMKKKKKYFNHARLQYCKRARLEAVADGWKSVAPAGALFLARAGVTVPGGECGTLPMAPGQRKRKRVNEPAASTSAKRKRVDEPEAGTSSDLTAPATASHIRSTSARSRKRKRARLLSQEAADTPAVVYKWSEFSARVGLAVGREGVVRLCVCTGPSLLPPPPPPPPPPMWKKVPSECGCAGVQCRACNVWACPCCNGKQVSVHGSFDCRPMAHDVNRLQAHLASESHRKSEAGWLAEGRSAVQLPDELNAMLNMAKDVAAAKPAKAAIKASRRQAEEEAKAAKVALKASRQQAEEEAKAAKVARIHPPPTPLPRQLRTPAPPSYSQQQPWRHWPPRPPPPLPSHPFGGLSPLYYAQPPPLYAPPPPLMTAWTHHTAVPRPWQLQTPPPPFAMPIPPSPASATTPTSTLNHNANPFVPGRAWHSTK